MRRKDRLLRRKNVRMVLLAMRAGRTRDRRNYKEISVWAREYC
jgi:hypothetical protein